MADLTDRASNQHPTYMAQQLKRDVYCAVESGTDGVRAGAVTYLPQYPAETSDEYRERKSRATIDGIVKGGVDTLCGSVFEGEVDTSKVNAQIIPLLENIDNKGNSFNIFARDTFRESFDGFSLILVDMPNGGADAERLRQIYGGEADTMLNARPYLNLYCASNVINWRFAVNPVSKKQELVLLVLKEVSEEPDGRFKVANVTRYRVFEWDGQIVKWELWRETKAATNNQAAELTLDDGGAIEKVKGIPVAFCGDVCDDPKLLVESRLEIKAYQKESSFDEIEYLSVPTFYTIGYEGEEKLKLGARGYIKIPNPGQGGKAEVGYCQIDSAGHDSLKGTIREIKDTIKARVNYLVESASVQQGPDKTATQVVSEDEDQKARLVVWADELKDCLETALMYMGQFMGLGDDMGGEIVLKTKWAIAAEKAQQAQEMNTKSQEANIKKTMADAQGA